MFSTSRRNSRLFGVVDGCAPGIRPPKFYELRGCVQRAGGHHFEDRRNPHRADLREDGSVVPIHGDVVRPAPGLIDALNPLDS